MPPGPKFRALDGGRGNSLLSLESEWVDDALSFRDSDGDLTPGAVAVGEGNFCSPFEVVPAAAAAACCARSFRDAFPRFLRSRMYSQPRPNSTVANFALVTCPIQEAPRDV